MRLAFAMLALAGLLAACSHSRAETPVARPTSGAAVIISTEEDCPVTRPSQNAFVPPAPWPALAPIGSFPGRYWHGSAGLWIALPDEGRWDLLLNGDKVFWLSEDFPGGDQEEAPALAMEARKLDGTGLVVNVPGPATNAFHADFKWAMLTSLDLPEPGCWEITGSYRGTFTTFVVSVSP